MLFYYVVPFYFGFVAICTLTYVLNIVFLKQFSAAYLNISFMANMFWATLLQSAFFDQDSVKKNRKFKF